MRVITLTTPEVNFIGWYEYLRSTNILTNSRPCPSGNSSLSSISSTTSLAVVLSYFSFFLSGEQRRNGTRRNRVSLLPWAILIWLRLCVICDRQRMSHNLAVSVKYRDTGKTFLLPTCFFTDEMDKISKETPSFRFSQSIFKNARKLSQMDFEETFNVDKI